MALFNDLRPKINYMVYFDIYVAVQIKRRNGGDLQGLKKFYNSLTFGLFLL